MRGGLFLRFLWRFLAGLAIATMVLFALVHVFQARVMDVELREQLRQETTWSARHFSWSTADRFPVAWRTMHEALRVAIFDAEGVLVGDSHPEHDPIDLAALLRGEEPSRHVAVAEELAEGGWLVLSRPYVSSFPRGLSWRLAALAIVLVLGPMLLLLYPLVRSMSRTLAEVGELARHVSAGRLGETLSVQRDDELGRLVERFNEMSRKLAEAERLSTRLLHDVSHELRSPLGRIQVMAETARMRPEEADGCLRDIQTEVELLDRLVDDLLSAARFEAGDGALTPEPFSLLAWSRETLGRLERSATSAGVSWSARVPSEDREVVGDRQRLAQALSNLVDNALHALADREGGRLDVEVALDDDHWSLTVSDDGPGIPEQHLPHVFHRFYRADEHRDREQGGAGLGLTLVREIARAHGGGAELENRAGGGVRATLTLPLRA